MISNHSFSAVVLLLAGSLCVCGCQQATEQQTADAKAPTPDAESVDASPEELITEIVGLNDQIRAASESDDLESAHGALHRIGTRIDQLQSLLRESELEESERQNATEAAAELMTLFGDVDATLHGREGKLYSEVSADIDSALQVLTGMSFP